MFKVGCDPLPLKTQLTRLKDVSKRSLLTWIPALNWIFWATMGESLAYEAVTSMLDVIIIPLDWRKGTAGADELTVAPIKYMLSDSVKPPA